VSRRKSQEEVRKIVWRMSAVHPEGVYIDLTAPLSEQVELLGSAEVTDRGWQASSRELRDGLRVSEAPMDTLPGELIDEFMKSKF
jgi:hypothetical protein